MEIKKFLKLENPTHGYYSHKDQREHGLRFKVFYSDNKTSLYGIRGKEAEIENYMKRFGMRIKELTDIEMKTEMDTYAPGNTITCRECNGTGTITIPAFDSTKAKTELDEVFVLVK